MMQEQAWPSLSSPFPFLTRSPRSTNPPPLFKSLPLNWHGTQQAGDQAGDSEVAPRLGLFTRAVALQRLWYFFFQMPGMERHVMGNTESFRPRYSRWLFFFFVSLSLSLSLSLCWSLSLFSATLKHSESLMQCHVFVIIKCSQAFM